MLRIGTRRSPLAMWQASHVRNLLLTNYPDLDIELVGISTQGDRTLDMPLSSKGGKGLFLKELQQALVEGQIDLAVHSMKDVTVNQPAGLRIAAICEREDPHDALVSTRYSELADFPAGASVGTCSLRRQCLLRFRYPDLSVMDLRGNVNTRLQRLDEGDFDGIILAAAGLKRLGMEKRIRQIIPADLMLPAVGQGALGVECREEDEQTNRLLVKLDHPLTRVRVTAERAVNEGLDGGCHLPVAAYAEVVGDRLRVRGLVGRPDGSTVLTGEAQGILYQAEALGHRLAEDLLKRGASRILEDFDGS